MFKDILNQVVKNIDGTVGCFLIGFDGIPIESVYTGEEIPEIDAIAVELSNLLDKFKRLQNYDMGEVDEVSVTIGDMTTLARVVGDEYLLMLALDPDADVGRGQNMLRLISPSIEEEIR